MPTPVLSFFILMVLDTLEIDVGTWVKNTNRGEHGMWQSILGLTDQNTVRCNSTANSTTHVADCLDGVYAIDLDVCSVSMVTGKRAYRAAV
jgi:hypothetical protein